MTNQPWSLKRKMTSTSMEAVSWTLHQTRARMRNLLNQLVSLLPHTRSSTPLLAVTNDNIQPPIIIQNRRNKHTFDTCIYFWPSSTYIWENMFVGHIHEYKWKMIKMCNPESVMQILYQRTKQRPTPTKNLGWAPTWEGSRPNHQPAAWKWCRGGPTQGRTHRPHLLLASPCIGDALMTLRVGLGKFPILSPPKQTSS